MGVRIGRGNTHVYLLLALIVLLWGNSFLMIKIAVETLNGIEFSFLRLLLTAIIFLPFLLIFYKKESIRILKNDGLYTAIFGIVGISGYHLLLNIGEEYPITSGTSGLIIGLVPICTMALDAVIGYERITKTWIIGTIVSMGGLVAVMFAKDEHGADHFLGILYTFAASWAWAVYTVMCRRLIDKKYPAFVTVGWGTILSLIPLPFMVSLDTLFVEKLPAAPLMFWVALFFLAVLCTFVAYLIWNYSLTKMSASKVSESVYFLPPVSVFFGWVFLGEPVGLLLILGTALIFGGVYFANLQSTEKKANG